MPAGPLAHVCLVVRDLDAAIERWREILGVLDPHQLEEPLVRYEHFAGGGDEVAMVIFPSSHGAEIQLLSPINDGPTARFLERHGEGVHHIAFTHPRVREAAGELAARGLVITHDPPMRDPGIPWLDFTFIRPDAANGAMIEICTPYRPLDGRWMPAGTGPRADTRAG